MTRPLRVAHVVGTAGSTGVESHLIALLAGFDLSRVEPTLFVPEPGPLVDALERRGLRVEFGAPSRKLALGEARRLAGRWRGSFDLVHAHGARAAFWSIRAARAAGIAATVATLHELRWRTLPPGPRRALWVALEDHALARFARLIAVSRSVREEVLARRPAWSDRVEVIPGSSPLLLDAGAIPSARPFAVPGAPLRLVSVGRLEWVKGSDRLLEAFARIARRTAATLEIAGSGSLEASLRARAETLGVADRVRWHGRVADYPGWLAGADLALTATRAETHGLSMLEAMAVGLPVVATGVGGLVELLEGGESGVLVAPEPDATLPHRFAEAVTEMAADPARARRLAERARARATGAFSPAVLAGRVAKLYEELAADRPRAR